MTEGAANLIEHQHHCYDTVEGLVSFTTKNIYFMVCSLNCRSDIFQADSVYHNIINTGQYGKHLSVANALLCADISRDARYSNDQKH